MKKKYFVEVDEMSFLVKDVMNPKVIAVKSDASLTEASKMMDSYKIGSLLVSDQGKIISIITASDILKAVSKGMILEETTVEEIMNEKLITIDADKTLEDAVKIMVENKIKKLPVVRDGEFVGIITASDIIVVEPKMIESIANLLSMKVPDYKGG